MEKLKNSFFWKFLVGAQQTIIIVTGSLAALIVAGACILRFFEMNFMGFEEILIFVVFWLYMMGCAYGSYEKSQITADILEVTMKESLFKDIIRLAKVTLTLVIGAFFVLWAVQLLMWTILNNTQTPVFRFPVAIGQSSIVVGMLLSTFYNFVYFVDEVTAFRKRHNKRKEAAKEVQL
ncbi:MAG: TRAP transporter small permease [Anaerovoracaceae bacterium]